MTFLDTIRQYAALRKAAPKIDPPEWALAEAQYQRWNLPSLDEVARQADLYARLSWVQIAVGAVAETAATTPMKIYQMRQGEDKKAIPNHPFEQLLRAPNPLMSRLELLVATICWRRVAGNCYWWLNKASPEAPPEEIWIMPAHQVQPVPDGQSYLKGYTYTPMTGMEVPLEPWEVVHHKTFNPLNPYLGLSPLQAVRFDAIGDLASAEYSANFYAKDNAKAAGILAFADFVEDEKWKRMQTDWKEQYGGRQNKRMMMLRGAGAGGVQWITTQMSQQDMQYLEQRSFTKEEIFALFAPGLASILAINATEANSTAGKDTFLTMAVYPQTVAIGEKATQAIMPSYGDNLVVEFDDVRRVDTLIELKEQEAYERTHTVDEVRTKYYQDRPIGDERGDELPGKVGSLKKPDPLALPFDQEPPTPDQAMLQAGKALDRRRWRDKAMKHLAAGRTLPDFDPDYLSDGEAMAIRAALKGARTADDVWRALGE